MTQSCIHKCRSSSLKEDTRTGLNNCMDRCIIKFEETRKIVEKELSAEVANR